MIGLYEGFAIASGVFGGGSAIMLLRWAVNLFFLRIDKREDSLTEKGDKLDAKGDKLLEALVARVEALTASEMVLSDRLTVTENALHDCQIRHIESERVVLELQKREAEREATIHELQVQVAQLRALPTNEGELP